MFITLDKLSPWLTSRWLGHQLLAEDSLESTNATAAQMGTDGAKEGLVIAADHQTGGRGRNGHIWFSPPGKNLYVSLLLRPDCPPGAVPQLAILCALSLRRALCKINSQAELLIKWPNDLWTSQQKKCCGILCSMSCLGSRTEYAIAGIGLNVLLKQEELPDDLRQTATSLAEAFPFPWKREAILGTFLSEFEQDYETWLSHGSLAPFLPEWNRYSILNGKNIVLEDGNRTIRGTVQGITETGELLLENSSGTLQKIAAGEAHILSATQKEETP